VQRTLSVYGTSVVQALPDMLLFLLRCTPTSVQPREEAAFDLACRLDQALAHCRDPMTGVAQGFPLGRDVIITAAATEAVALRAVSAERNLCRRASMVLHAVKEQDRMQEIVRHGSTGTVEPGDVAFSEVGLKQVVFPLVFGSLKPVSPREVRELDEFVKRLDEVSCMKLLGTRVDDADAARHTVLFGTVPGMMLDALEARLHRVCQDMPVLAYQAVKAMGLMGAQVYEDDWSPPANYPFGCRSLATAYANHLEKIYEQ